MKKDCIYSVGRVLKMMIKMIESHSLKKNFLYSSILTVSNYLFPMLVFPYVSRVLGVENIGMCNFVDSIVNYFMLFSMMGISVMGIREISLSKGNRMEMSRTFCSLLVLNGIFTIVAFVTLWVITLTVASLQVYRQLLYVSMFKLLGNFLLIEWFFKGLENFKYITNRTIIVKIGYVVAVFVCVREQDDYVMYYVLTMLMVLVNALINVFYSIRVISFPIGKIQLKKYMKPFCFLGFYMLLTNMYTSFNIIYLGFVRGPVEVGYYTTATKLYTIIVAFFTAFTSVMLPRMSSLLSENRREEFLQMVEKAVRILVSLGVPAVVLCTMYSSQIIHILAGGGYDGAIVPAIIVMPLLFVIGYEQIMVIQVLMPSKQDKVVFRNAVAGAVIGVVLNVAAVPSLGAVGSAIVWVVSECLVLVLSQVRVTRLYGIKFPLMPLLKTVVVYLPLVLFGGLLYVLFDNEYTIFTIAIVTSLVYFAIVQMYILPDTEIRKAMLKIADRLKFMNAK